MLQYILINFSKFHGLKYYSCLLVGFQKCGHSKSFYHCYKIFTLKIYWEFLYSNILWWFALPIHLFISKKISLLFWFLVLHVFVQCLMTLNISHCTWIGSFPRHTGVRLPGTFLSVEGVENNVEFVYTVLLILKTIKLVGRWSVVIYIFVKVLCEVLIAGRGN